MNYRNHPATSPWLQPPPAAGPFDGALTPGPRWSAWLGHTHLHRPQPNPGAPAFAYVALGLSEFTPIGAATVNRERIREVAQAGEVLFANLGLRTTGLGGLVQGQFVTPPLVVPNALQLDVGGDETAFGTG